MTEIKNSKQYDLEERTLRFAKEVIEFVGILPKTVANIEIMKQIIRSSGSVGANYIEANEALSKKGFYNEGQDLSQGSQREQVLAEAYRGKRRRVRKEKTIID